MKVIAAGTGPGALECMTGQAVSAIREADLVLTSERLAESLKELNPNVQVMGVMDTVRFINAHSRDEMTVCAAASGDTGFYSIASTIARNADPEVELDFVCGAGSMAYFAAKLKTGYENMKLVSLHGRDRSIVPFVCYNEKVFALTGGNLKAHDVINQLLDAGMDSLTVHVGENLSMDSERIVSGTPSELSGTEFGDLSVIIVENKYYVNRYKTLKDSDFVRGKSPMTKENIRSLSLAALEIEPSDVVYDIGAGTGSVTCAMAYRACESMVYAVEKEADAVELVKKNMEVTGAYNICIRHGLAPERLSEFPPADKVFIGGSTGNLREIMETVLTGNEKAVFVITAVTIETLIQAVSVAEKLSLRTEISCINAASAQKLGRYNLMKAENPVYIIKGVKDIEV